MCAVLTTGQRTPSGPRSRPIVSFFTHSLTVRSRTSLSRPEELRGHWCPRVASRLPRTDAGHLNPLAPRSHGALPSPVPRTHPARFVPFLGSRSRRHGARGLCEAGRPGRARTSPHRSSQADPAKTGFRSVKALGGPRCAGATQSRSRPDHVGHGHWATPQGALLPDLLWPAQPDTAWSSGRVADRTRSLARHARASRAGCPVARPQTACPLRTKPPLVER